VDWTASTAPDVAWTIIIAMLLCVGHSVQLVLLPGQSLKGCCCGLDSQYNKCCVLVSHFSDVPVGRTVNKATVTDWTVIIAVLLCAGQLVQKMFRTGQSF